MANWIAALCVLLGCAVAVKAQVNVNCFTATNCGGDRNPSTEEDCCTHGVAPFGLSFTIPGIEGCFPCPVVFGFVEPTFTAEERVVPYTDVQLAFLSGEGAFGAFRVFISYTAGTATENVDVQITSPGITIDEVVPQAALQTSPVEMIFRLDGIAQESNETFTLGFMAEPGALGTNPTLRDTMQGTVVDANTVTFQLSEADYREPEGENALMPVIISKASDVFIANPVEFMVFPITVDMAIAQGVIPDFEPLNIFSPNRADFNDFNNSVITAIFPADEGRDPITDLDVPIPVFDDNVDEADDQFFVAHLVLVNAINRNLINIARDASNCIIVDNDPIRIGFQFEQYDYFEPETTQILLENVTLIREDNRVSEQTFGIQITFGDPGQEINPAILQQPGDQIFPDGQANGFDFVISIPGTNVLSLSFPPQLDRVTVSFTLFPDTLAEGTEGFRAGIGSVGAPFAVFQLPSTATRPRPMPPAFPDTIIRILDTDFAVVGFERDNYTVNETESSVQVCALVFNPPLDEALAFDINTEASTREDTAGIFDFRPIVAPFTRPVIFGMSSGSPPMVRRVCFDIQLRQDTTYEDTECFFADLALATGVTGVRIEPPVTKIFIVDDDELVIGFMNHPYNVSENEEFATVEFGIISGRLSTNTIVSAELFFTDQTAISGSDYQAIAPQAFTFTTSITRHTFDVPIINDTAFELTEYLQAGLRFVSGEEPPPRVTLEPAEANVNILDDDVIVYGFSPPTSSAEEGNTASLIVMQLSGNPGTFEFSLLAITDDSNSQATATAGADYSSTMMRLAPFNSVTTSANFAISTLNDDFTELTEIFFVDLRDVIVTDAGGIQSLSAQELGRIVIAPDQAQVDITDTDFATIGFAPVMYSVVEDDGPVNFNFSVLQGNIAFNVGVLFFTTGGSAISDEDFNSTSDEYNITGQGFVLAPVEIINDFDAEETENFFGNLAFGSGGSFSNIRFQPDQAVATIIDEDELTFGFDPDLYTVIESREEVEFMVRLVSGTLVREVVIEFFTSSGTAEAPGDYSETVMLLTFGPGVSSVSVIVPVVDDSLVEIDETFFGNLRLPAGVMDRGSILFRPERAMAIILDQSQDPDTAVIGFLRNYTVTEGVDFMVDVEIGVLDGSLGRDIVVEVFTMDGSARDPSDYSRNTERLTFSPAMTSGVLRVAITNDDVVENIEQFLARARLVTTDAPGVTIAPESSTVTIMDDDEVTIGFDATSYDIFENERGVNVTIVLTGVTDRFITVILDTQDGTAISSGAERDFVPIMSMSITFPPSTGPTQTRVVRINVIDDMFVENDENLRSIITLSAPNEPVMLNPAEASILIRNDDDVVIGFDRRLYEVAENVPSGNAVIQIRIIRGVLRIPVTVTFRTEDNTALDGSDYAAVGPMDFVFDRNRVSYDIEIPIINDNIHEITENFRGLLSSSEDPNILTLRPAATTIQINDDERVTFSFRQPMYTFIENMGTGVVFIDRTGNTDQTIMLMLSGSLQAETGQRIDQIITFGPSDSSISVNFTVFDDLIALEPTEMFDWTLSLVTVVDRVSVEPFNRTSISIMDNDDLELALSKNGQVNESAGTAQACISFSADYATDFVIGTGSGMPVNVTVPGTATNGSDYTAPPPFLQATAGTYGLGRDLCFDIPILDDEFVELEECFIISISLPPESANLGVSIADGQVTALCCIIDNDRITIGFEQIRYEVDEPDGQVSVRVIVIDGDNLQRPAQVTFSTRDGTATSTVPRDYENLGDIVLQFDNTQRTRTVTIPIDDDDILEDSENFFGQLRTTQSFVDVAPAQTEIVIFEIGDEVRVGFNPETYTVNEADGSVTLNVEVLEGTLERSVTVLFQTSPGTATESEPEDYTGAIQLLTFTPSVLNNSVSVTIINDDIVEGNETFFAVIDPQGQPVITRPDTASVLITEDPSDSVTIGFEETSYSTDEGDTIMVCARILRGAIERDVEVEVASADETATAGEDYVRIPGLLLTFTPAIDRRCFDVTALDDTVLEMLETFALELDTDDSMVTLDPQMARVNITDTDGITVGLEQTEFTATEGFRAFIEVCAVITSPEELERNALVTLRSADGTASSPADFEALDSVLTFTPEIRRVCRNITINNDDFYEDDEDFTVSLSTSDPSVTIDPARQTGTATILDNDEIIIGFERETYTAIEGTNDNVQACVVVLSGMLERSATVTVDTTDAGSGIGFATEGEDYTQSMMDFTFTNANQGTPQCLTIPIIDDNLIEGNEFFFGVLSNTNNIPRLILSPQRTNIAIIDDEVLQLGFINEPYREREDNGFQTVTVAVQGDLGKTLEVRLYSAPSGDPNEAIAGVDYLPIDTNLTFNEDVNQISFNVTTVVDSFVEGDETYQVRLAILTEGANIMFFPAENALVTILDDDRVVIGLEDTFVTVREDVGTTELCASVMSGSLMREVLVDVVYQNRNALDGEDYIANPQTLTFSSGVSRVCFNTTILNDDRYELNEDFFVNITTTDSQVDINPMSAIVTIEDDEELIIGWEELMYNVSEAQGSVEICAIVIDGIQTVTLPLVSILTAEGTATEASDYDPAPNPRTFNFQPGQPLRMCTTITVVMDGVVEEQLETLFADLDITLTERVRLDPARTQINILDSDAVRIGFDPVMYSTREGDGVVRLEVAVLEGNLDTDVVVRFDTRDDSAGSFPPNPDYTVTERFLMFSSDVDRVTVNVTIIDDQIAENPEQFFADLTLITVNDRVSIAPRTANVIISDNDVPVIGFENTVYMTVENNTVTREVCARVFGPPALDRTVTVTLQSRDGSAMAPADYNSITSMLVFSPGNERQCVLVNATEDDETEGRENFNVTLTSTDEVRLDPNEAIVFIMDGDAVTIGFEMPSYTFNEDGVTGTIYLVKDGVSSSPITVRVSGGPSTQTDVVVSAEGLMDQEVTFDAGPGATNRIAISFGINDDEIGLEAVEMYIASFEIISSVGNVVPGMFEQTTINILDNDIVNIGFGRPNVTVPEDDGEFMMCVTKDRVTLMDVIVTISTSPGTATEGIDYRPEDVPTTVTIPAGEFRMCFDSDSIVNDSVALEDDETFTLNITDVDPDDERIRVTEPMTTVIIVDSDVVRVRFEQPSYTVFEDAGEAEVCLIKEPRTAGQVTIDNVQTVDGTATAGQDYTSVATPVTFGRGSGERRCIRIPITDDTEMEDVETFSVILNLPVPGRPDVLPGSPDIAVVHIRDRVNQVLVNDTVIGDPLFTVPILVDEEQLQALNLSSLTMCYEIHGSSDQWFNLVTDECASVNSRYTAINDHLNIIDEIGVRAVDNDGRCVNIRVDVDGCRAEVNDQTVDRYSRGGISVRRYSNRVRISVPNCNELTLVMWVICQRRTLEDPFQPGMTVTGDMIKFVVMRGLNFGHRRAHGLLGQYWNIPVDVAPYTGQLRSGEQSEGRFVLNLTTFGSAPRSFTGWLYDLTWEFEEGPCLYVGNRQGGPIYEVPNPNDRVIAELYSDYRVNSAFSEENYDFGLFSEERCTIVGSGNGVVNPPPA